MIWESSSSFGKAIIMNAIFFERYIEQ